MKNTKGTILIVDHTADLLTQVSDILINNNYNIITVNPGELAIQTVRKKKPDLILLNVMAPEIDGYKVCRLLKSNIAISFVPIIFLSPLSDAKDRLKAYRSGVADFIAKPFEIEELLQRIESQMDLIYLKKKLKIEIRARELAEKGIKNQLNKYKVIHAKCEKLQNGIDDFFKQQKSLHVLIRLDRTIKKINSNVWFSILGYQQEEIMGSDFIDFVHQDDIETTLEEFVKIRKGQKEFYAETRFMHKKVCYIHLAWSGFLLEREEPSVYATATDITAQKLEKEELVKNEEKLEMIFDSSQAIILLVSSNLQIIKANKTSLTNFNANLDDVVNKHPGEIFNCINTLGNPDGCGHSKACKCCVIRNVITDTIINNIAHNTIECEVVSIIKGVKAKSDFLLSTIKVIDKPIPSYLITMVDVSYRKAYERALNESEIRFKQLADLATEGIVIHEKGVIRYFNTAFQELTGYSKRDLIDKVLFNITPVRYHELIKNKMTINIASLYEIELITKKGNLIPFEVKSRLDKSMGSRFRIATFKDVTDKKMIQQKLICTAINVEETERKRVAQDLHDGIGSILSIVKFLNQALDLTKEEGVKNKIRLQITSSIDEALKQVSTISQNLSPTILQNYGLKSAIKKYMLKLEQASIINFTFEYCVKCRLKEELEITFYRLALELINNTIKHSEASELKLSIFTVEAGVKLVFFNNGMSFNFNKIKNKKKGMGLHNIYNRIISLNGSFKFTSTENKGICYTIVLPL